ncbi:hypothetical protein ACGFX4_23590 [Kitasatospora sp. NPDC048365]|uniref:hypothetical protein n=1 Tax=Kitasatospora sp. NPDC048365 TaxID=3364050 RepID=UPI00372248CD
MATFMVFIDGDPARGPVTRAALAPTVHAHWPDAEPSPGRGWLLPTPDGPGEVHLPEDGTGLYLDVPWHDAVRLAIAFRRLVPAGLGVVFCDEGYTFAARLPSDATDAELTELMTAA